MKKSSKRHSAKQESLIKQYKKERSRILGYVSRKRREGFNTEEFVMPAIPKKISEGSIRKLQKITPGKIREKIYYISPYTGEYVHGTSLQSLKRVRAQDSIYHNYDSDIISYIDASNQYDGDNFNDIISAGVISGFLREVRNLNNQTAFDFISGFIDSWIFRDGESTVSDALLESANKGIYLTVDEGDSEDTAKRKSINFLTEILMLSGEYSKEGAGLAIEDYIEDY